MRGIRARPHRINGCSGKRFFKFTDVIGNGIELKCVVKSESNVGIAIVLSNLSILSTWSGKVLLMSVDIAFRNS